MVSGAEGRASRMLHLDVQRLDDGLVLGLAGELDVADADALRAVFSCVSQERLGRIIVDLTNLSFIDSTGLGVLVRARKQAQGAGSVFAVVCPPGRIRDLFGLTHLDVALHVVDTLAEALSVRDETPTDEAPTPDATP